MLLYYDTDFSQLLSFNSFLKPKKMTTCRRWPCSHICELDIPAKLYMYIILVSHQHRIFISFLWPCSESCTYQSSLFFLNVLNRKQYSCVSRLHIIAHELRLGTASGKYFSISFASGKSTTLLQLHMDLQILGGLVAGWNTLWGSSAKLHNVYLILDYFVTYFF